MNSYGILVVTLCILLAGNSRAQSVGLQASLFDPLYGAGHLELSMQPIDAITIDVAYGRRFGMNLGILKVHRHIGWIADVAVLYNIYIKPKFPTHLLQIGGYWQRKNFDERLRRSVGFVFPSTIETVTAIDMHLAGARFGYRYVTPGGFTTSFHLGLARRVTDETRLISTTSNSVTTADRFSNLSRGHVQLRFKLGYTFQWN